MRNPIAGAPRMLLVIFAVVLAMELAVLSLELEAVKMVRIFIGLVFMYFVLRGNRVVTVIYAVFCLIAAAIGFWGALAAEAWTISWIPAGFLVAAVFFLYAAWYLGLSTQMRSFATRVRSAT